jgi:hypothetical protein
MNDRGLNLTPTEMLKGFILTHIKDSSKIEELNIIWKSKISNLHKYSTQEDIEFIRAWLRSQYADSIQSVSKGAENADFEKIGTRFHTWVKDNHKKMSLNNSDSFYNFVKGDFEFYSSIYEKIKEYESTYTIGVERLYLLSYLGIASSLSYPLLMASINKLDDEKTILNKLDAVSTFIDILIVTRAINYKGYSQSFLRYIIYSLVKEIRNKSLSELRILLKEKLTSSKENLDQLEKFGVTNSGSRKFMHYLIARCLLYTERTKYGNININMNTLMAKRKQSRFVLTPIVSEYNSYQDYFENEDTFVITEKKIGNYILIPNLIAIDFKLDFKPSKINKIAKEYRLTKSITNSYYTGVADDDYLKSLNFSPFTNFKESIDQRTISINSLIREIWNVNNI